MFRSFLRDLLPVGVSSIGFLGLPMPGVALILGVDLGPVLGQVRRFTAGLIFTAIGEEFASEQHPVVAQGVADHEQPISHAEHKGDGAVVKMRTISVRQASIVVPHQRVRLMDPLRCRV